MELEGYMPRLIEQKLDMEMGMYGAVCIEGAMACGKTWLGKSRAVSMFDLNDPNKNFLNLKRVMTDVNVAFDGKEPRLIDEWQECPSVWDAAKNITDRSTKNGRYILTGSSTPRIKGVKHTGTGRIGTIRMRPMSLFESGDSKGTVSLTGLFDGRFTPDEPTDNTLEKLVGLTVRGGWPKTLGMSEMQYVEYSRDYIESIVRKAAKMDGVERNETKMRMFVRSLARNESTLVSNSTISSDVTDMDVDPSAMERERSMISERTIPLYSSVLERMFIVDNQPAFSFNARSSVRVGKSPKRHLVDPSLSIAALGLTPKRLISDLNTYGFMFESMCFRDLRIYMEAHGGSVTHYHDDRNREIDAMVENYDGDYGAIEIKLGENQVDTAAKNLITLSKKFEEDNLPVPKFMCVICGTAAGSYRRPDGVYVVPITHLRD